MVAVQAILVLHMLIVVFLEKHDRRALTIRRIIVGIGLGTENGKADKYGSQNKKQRYVNNLFLIKFHMKKIPVKAIPRAS